MIDKLKPNPSNPRTIKQEAFVKLKKSLREFPEMLEIRPIIYDNTFTVLGGNMRLRALEQLKNEGFEIKDTWFKQVSELTEAQKREFIIKDNGSFGQWDDDMLANEWSDLPLEEWGIDTGGWKSDEVTDDEAPELSTEPAISKLGEVYQLGRHRLMCGDSTKIEDVEKLMNGQKADMVFTDPPYNVNFQGANFNPRAKEWEGIKNDNMGEDFDKFVLDVFSNAITVGVPAMPIYAWVQPMREGFRVYDALIKCGVHIQSQIVWNKNTMVLGQADYQWKHEVCWYGYTEGTHHKWNGGRDKYSVWEISKDANSSYEHPTQKPVQLAHTAVTNSSDKDANVLDLFGGSGSTLIACEQLNRTCYMMEIDPKYCDVIRKRYYKFIGKEDEWNK